MTCRIPAPYEPGLDPKIRVVARRSSPCSCPVGVGVPADVVVLVGLVEAGHEADGVVEHRDHVREGVAEEAGDPHDHVDPGPAELGERDGFQPDDAARGLVPGRQHAEQGEHLGDVVA